MESSTFDQLRDTLAAQGPAAAIDQLCNELRDQEKYNSLFYALLMRARNNMGVDPVPTGPAQALPRELHPAYEDAIRDAAREVGNLLLAQGSVPEAWLYFRMIDEPAPIKAALEALDPADDVDMQPLISIAFYEGVHPTRGFDWVLARHGLCSAITTASNPDLPHPAEVKEYCVRALIRTLYHDLRERLAAEIAAHSGTPAPEASAPRDTPGIIRKLIQGRDWLFADEAYHIDTSHLSSVVQMSLALQACLELSLASDLCSYGAKLQGRFLGHEDPPFEKGYTDYGIYLGILTGEAVETGLKHFQDKLAAYDPEEIGTYPAEVFVNLLLRLGRGQEALEVARKYLGQAEAQGRPLTCPNLNELCQKLQAYSTLAEIAREQGDPVHYLAGMIADSKRRG